jgi:hypothetical protein
MYLRRGSDGLDDFSGGGLDDLSGKIEPPQQQHDEAAAAVGKTKEGRPRTAADPDHTPYTSPEPKYNQPGSAERSSGSFDPKTSTGMFGEDKGDKKKNKKKPETSSQKPTAAEGKEIDLFTGGKNNRHKFGKGKLKSKAQKKIIAAFVAMMIGGGGAVLTGGGFLATFRLFIFDGALHEAFDAPHQNALMKRSFRNTKPLFDQDGDFVGRSEKVKGSPYGKSLREVKINNIASDLSAGGVTPNFDPNTRTLLGFTNADGEIISAVDDFAIRGRKRAIKLAMKEIYPRGRLRRAYASRLAYKRYGGSARFLLTEKALGKTEAEIDKASERLVKKVRKKVLNGDTDAAVSASTEGGRKYEPDEDGNITDGDGGAVKADAEDVDVANSLSDEFGELGPEVDKIRSDLVNDPKLDKPRFNLFSKVDLAEAFKRVGKKKTSILTRSPLTIAQYVGWACSLKGYLNIILSQSRDIKEQSATRVDSALSSGAQQAAADPDGPSGEEIDALNNDITSTKDPGAEMQSSEFIQATVMAGTGSPVAGAGAAGLYGFITNLPAGFAGLNSVLSKIPQGMCSVAMDVKFQVAASALEIGLMFVPGGQLAGVFKKVAVEAGTEAVEKLAVGAIVRGLAGSITKGAAGSIGIHLIGEVLKDYAINSLAGVNADTTEDPDETATGWGVGRFAGTNATARELGSPELNLEQATAFNQEAIEDHRIELALMPWSQRYFSYKHSASLVSVAALNAPSTAQSGLKTGIQYAMRTTNPSFAFRKNSTFMKYAQRIIKSGSVYALSNEEAARKARSIKNTTGVNQFGWTEADMNRFPDADDNAKVIYDSDENTKAFEAFSATCFDSVKSEEFESDECRRQDDMAWRFRTLRLDTKTMDTMAETSNPEYANQRLSEIVGGGSSAAAPTAGDGVGTLPADVEALKQIILTSDKITFDQGEDKTDIERGSGTACGAPSINPNVYRLLAAILKQFPDVPLRIGSINSGHHCSGGFHDQGQAVDIANEEVGQQIMPWLLENRQDLKLNEMVFNGASQYNMDNGEPKPGLTWPDHDNHIHLGVNP